MNIDSWFHLWFLYNIKKYLWVGWRWVLLPWAWFMFPMCMILISFLNSHPTNQWISTVTELHSWPSFQQHTLYSPVTLWPQLEAMACEFCTCFFCLSLIRTYMVQVQKQAQEQELFPPVKWVWVVHLQSPWCFRKKTTQQRQGLCKLQSVSCHWTFTPFLSPPFLSHPALALRFFSWLLKECWRPVFLE